MVKRYPFAGSLLWGAVGFVTGFGRTYVSTKHLLDKNVALRDAGLNPLPGEGHYEVLASLKPALAGGMFYALALGAGAAALAWLFGSALRLFPAQKRKYLFSLALIPPLLVLLGGDIPLALSLAVIVFPSCRTGMEGSQIRPKEAIEPVLAVVLLLLSASPVFFAETGGFLLVRNALVNSSLLRPVSNFYYEWTLYPAESIKPLYALSQPVGKIPPEMEEKDASILAREARLNGISLVRSEKGFDFEFGVKDGALTLKRGGVTVDWPERSREGQSEAFKELSNKTDSAKVLRRTMLTALLAGGTLALAIGIYRLTLLLPARLRRELFVILAALIFILSYKGGSRSVALEKTAEIDELRAALESPVPSERVYAALGARRFARQLEPELIKSLDDPVPNVRYNAATALGNAGTLKSRETLLSLVKGPNDWYIKDRAWWALRRM